MICDGCGLLRDDVGEPDAKGLAYCTACAERRDGDPTIFVHGRTLTYSELEAQAESDEHLAAALPGDSVQEQLR